MKKYSLILLSVLFLSCINAQEEKEDLNIKYEIIKTDSEWKKELDSDAYKVLCGGETERAFTGKYLNNKEEGTYCCAACKNPLFSSAAKFDSGSGWPSFFNQIDDEAIIKKIDDSYGMSRVEILCSKCGGHLGHLFEDGPTPTELRYCVNSVSLDFINTDTLKTKK